MYKNWISGIFDGAASDYGNENTDYFNIFAKRLVQLASLSPNATVLDIATGRGAILKEVLKVISPTCKAIGIDISKSMIEETSSEMSQKGYSNYELFCMDAEELNFDKDTFNDLFCAFGVFFFPNIDSTLKGFLKVLKPGGSLWLSTWSERGLCSGNIVDAFAQILGRDNFNTPLTLHRFDDKESIEHMLIQAGFKDILITSETIDFIYPTFEDWFSSLWSHASRGRFEKLNTQQLHSLKKILEHKIEPLMQPDGLHEHLGVHYIKACKT